MMNQWCASDYVIVAIMVKCICINFLPNGSHSFLKLLHCKPVQF